MYYHKTHLYATYNTHSTPVHVHVYHVCTFTIHTFYDCIQVSPVDCASQTASLLEGPLNTLAQSDIFTSALKTIR